MDADFHDGYEETRTNNTVMSKRVRTSYSISDFGRARQALQKERRNVPRKIIHANKSYKSALLRLSSWFFATHVFRFLKYNLISSLLYLGLQLLPSQKMFQPKFLYVFTVLFRGTR
jgi:hypothetical protein